MAAALVGEAVIGTVFGEFMGAVLEVKDHATEFKPRMEELGKNTSSNI